MVVLQNLTCAPLRISTLLPTCSYHAWEATEALKEFLGEYYVKSDENMYTSLFKNYSLCKFVEDTGSCVFYKNRFGQAAKKVVYEEDSGVDVKNSQSSDDEI